MAIKKSDLYSSLWASCDELRGAMDASQYKDYVLTLLFMKYVTDKAKRLKDRYLLDVSPGASFDDMVLLKGDKEIGDKINKIIGKLAEENDLKGVIDVADFNDEDKLGRGKDMIDRLSNLVGIFEGLDLSANRAEGDDLLGDAYEYLMRHFATESGKAKGQFYTPAEVSRILAKVIGITPDTPQFATVYDPACGSGSLLLKVADEAPRGLSIFGQEMDNSTAALARMNMILHDNETAKIWQDNTLANPYWKSSDGQLETFDFAVMNPPFSLKSWSNGVNVTDDEYRRFEYGTPPEKNGDYAFFLHVLKSLKSKGKGAIILPHGVLFRGNKEADIRERIIKQGYIKGIIGLPANLFYGTGIPACIIVIDKENAISRKGIFMVDASKGFIKDGNKNRLRSRDIHKIVDVFNSELELERYSRMVSLDEIAANDYNLNIPRYIDASDPEDLHDLSAHLSGGIPNRDIDALEEYWRAFPNLRKSLFKPARAGYCEGRVAPSDVKSTILNHDEFKAFAKHGLRLFHKWATHAELKTISKDDLPREIIRTISESLLAGYGKAGLLDKYAIYQILMDYWADTMQDDVYFITQYGWEAGSSLRELVAKKGEKLSETPDLIVNKVKYKAEVIPPALIIARFFCEDRSHIEELQTDLERGSQELESYIEEHNVDEGLLADAQTAAGKITKASVTARIKEATDADEVEALQRAKQLIEADAAYKKALKASQDVLDKKVLGRYSKLTKAEIQTLVVEDKWQTTLATEVQAEIERVTQTLANRVEELEERYEEPLPNMIKEVAALSHKVDKHLKAMGLEW